MFVCWFLGLVVVDLLLFSVCFGRLVCGMVTLNWFDFKWWKDL